MIPISGMFILPFNKCERDCEEAGRDGFMQGPTRWS